MRENTEQMQLPRFLWVPFPLGRPFGTPGEPDFQRRVLRDALALLEREDGPVVLEDFPDDAPVVEEACDEVWACPISFERPTEDDSALVGEVLAEVAKLAPWHDLFVSRGGRPVASSTGLSHEAVIRGLGVLAEQGEPPQVETELPLLEWVRLGCDEVRAWYLEAAQGQPARPAVAELDAWFWRQTALARLIARAALHFAESSEPVLQLFGRRSMVPRAHMGTLMPGVVPSSGELPQATRSRA